MKQIDLKEIIRDEKYNCLLNYNIKIYNVTIIKDENLMIVNILADNIIKLSDEALLNNLFKELFTDLKIEIKIKYNCDLEEEDVFINYERNLKEVILKKTPSSKSWIDCIRFVLEKDKLTLKVTNQIATSSIKRNGLIAYLQEKIKNEFSLSLILKEIEEEDFDCESFLEEKIKEEQEISKQIVIQSQQDIGSKSSGKGTTKGEKVNNYTFGKNITISSLPINEVTIESGHVAIKGEIFDMETREIRGNRMIVTLYITDNTDSMPAKIFLNEDKIDDFLLNVSVGDSVMLEGDVNYDPFARMKSMMFRSLKKVKKDVRLDLAEEKRIELHLHTKMSAMDSSLNVSEAIKRAKDWGHEAIAITDHGVVQAYPEAMNASEKHDIKVIYGLEGYLVDDAKKVVENYDSSKKYDTYIVFDIETTGLSPINDGITEIGAIKIQDNKVIDKFSQLVNPEKNIPTFITELTGITNDMVKDKPTISKVINEFYDFIGEDVLVAHNAAFDIGFIREKLRLNNLSLNNPVLDTLELARSVFPNLKNHKLDTLAKHLGVSLENHHRAVDDAQATTEIFVKILESLEERNITSFDEINNISSRNNSVDKSRPYHIVLLVQNLTGLKNLYKLVSKSHMDHFYRNPRIPKSLLEEYKEGLLIGSACEAGELYSAILKNASYNEIRNIVNFYDYLEIQPIGNNMHLIERGILKDITQLQDINKKIYELGKKYNKPVVATGDVHFLEPEDEVYRRILMAGQGFKDADNQSPLYFKTTDEMLEEFSYLGEDISKEVVIDNPKKINELIDRIRPIPKGTFPPVLEGSDEDLKTITYKKAYEVYGDPLPEIVKARLDRELNAIIKNGYSVMYIIAQKLVWKSIEDGYLVGSRGSVGSSFVATMSGITEVNPLAPHYVCPNCQYSEFFEGGVIESGSDLEDKNCPKCNTQLIKDGHDIPFEVFLGFEGDKEPDIDLNFASEYQSNAHKYTEELFGEGYVFRAGTIGTIAERTAYGFVKKYFEQSGDNVNPAETNRLVKGCTGVRRSSGQHPGGVMIVPKHKEIFDFSPIQYPANDKDSGVITTHFDYDAISSQILKLDILGHDVPGIIKNLEDFTGVNPLDIPLDEKSTMSIFSSTEALNVDPKDIDSKVGTLGIPEFGTKFVRQMLVDTKPTKFSELVRISGLSHGTDVWLNNAQDLVRSNMAELSDVISTREDIMLTLINAGMDKQKAFWIMEKVRKGKPLPDEDIEAMRKVKLPPWYIDSCEKIKYMFPKAHAVAYVMMSFRIAYFKVHHPQAFYSTYFTTKAADFDAELILQGKEAVEVKIKELEDMGNDITAKEKNLLTVLEVVREMYARGYEFLKVDLYKSDSDKFLIEDGKILPPLKGLEGVGENAARNIVKERVGDKFISIEDLVQRTKVTKTVVEALSTHGCLEDLPESNQISLFNI